MNKFFINRKESIAIALAGLASVLLVSGVVYSSSTISGNISTGGTLGVSGLSTLSGFISTASSTVIGQANASTLSVTGASTLTGAATLSSTLDVTGLSTLTGFVSNASSTAVIANASTLSVTGLSTLTGGYVSQASSTVVGTLHVGAGSNIAAMVMGVCFLKNATIAASSTGYADCTATDVLADDRVFVQATSSLPARFIIQSASSTTNGLINVQVFNIGAPNATNITLMATGSLNFWAVR